MAYPNVHACNLAQMFGHICTATCVLLEKCWYLKGMDGKMKS